MLLPVTQSESTCENDRIVIDSRKEIKNMALIGILLIFAGIGNLIESLGILCIRNLLPMSFFIKHGTTKRNFKYCRNAVLMTLAGFILMVMS